MDSQPEFFEELPETANPRRDFAKFRAGEKIIQIPCSFWKDGRIRADLSKYGKGEVVSRNRLNLTKRIREIFANALAETDELVAEAESIESSPRVRNRHSPQAESVPMREAIDFIRPADYRGEFSNCPSEVDRMIGPTHLQKRLFGYLWAGAKCTGLKSHRLVLAAAAAALGATDTGVKKAAEQLRDAWNLIWFEKTNLGRAGWTDVRFPRPPWMPIIPNSVRDSSQEPNPEDCSTKPEQSSQNPEDCSGSREGDVAERRRKNREKKNPLFSADLMPDQIFNCAWCGGPTRSYQVLGVSFPIRCDKCRASYLTNQNLARVRELDRQWRELCPPLFRATDRNHPAIDQDALAKLLEWDPATAGGKGIGLRGPTGGCKTRMMFLLLDKLHYRGVKVRWIPAIELSRASAEMFDGDDAIKREARRLMQNAIRAKVLFIDDIGKERFTDRTELELFYLIETRISFLRPILWTSNASGVDLRKAMSGNRGPALTRRLAEFSKVYFVTPLYDRAKPIEQLATSARSA